MAKRVKKNTPAPAESTPEQAPEQTPAGATGAPVIEGLAEAQAKSDLVAELAKLQAQKASADKASNKEAKALSEQRVKMELKQSGTFHEKLNPNTHHNPQILPETVRRSEPGEEINGKPAKAWVVGIWCAHCREPRWINTQDAFQTRFCDAHKTEGRKAKKRAEREEAKTAELAKLDPEELAAKIAALKAELGQTEAPAEAAA